MKSIKYYLKSRWPILLVTVVFFLIRLIKLDQMNLIPDERDLFLTSYSLAKTGRDLLGNYLPLVFDRISPHVPPVPVYYGMLIWLTPLAKSVYNARLAFVLPATFLPLLVYELIFALGNNKKIAFLCSIIFSFSPWIYHISRLGLEINLALPLLLTALLAQIKKNNFLAFIIYGLVFFTYQGFAPMVLVIPVFYSLYEGYLQKFSYRQIFLKTSKYFIFFLIFFGISLLIEKNVISRSSNEILFFNSTKLTADVNFYRNISRGPQILRTIFNNKILTMTNYFLNNLFKGVDFSYLFLKGDYVAEFSNNVTGQFFPIYSLFLLFGLFSLSKKNQAKDYFMEFMFQ